MEIRKPGDSADAPRHGAPEVRAGIGIKKTLLFAAALLQPDLGGLIGALGFKQKRDRIAGIVAMGDVPELVLRQPDALHGDFLGTVAQSFEDFVAEDDGAAADTDKDHVKAQADTGPQVDLEQRLAEPDALRPPQPLLPKGHPTYDMRERSRTHP